MIEKHSGGVRLVHGQLEPARSLTPEELQAAKSGTIAYSILSAHNTSGTMADLKLRFDAMASHDITYVGIVQTARASGLKEFPIPYVLTNCHNSLCAVGGTINEDDHLFGLSAAKKYGGEFVPAHLAVIHQYMREMYSACGKMILASDSHTRYGPVGTLSVGEGGPELVKQLLCYTYDLKYPEVVGIWLEGTPRPGVGPQDVALALIAETFADGWVKNKVLEFIGPGVSNLSMDYRFGIDVMTTETTCLSSVWRTDAVVQDFLTVHGRPEAYKELNPGEGAYYDSMIRIDLSRIEPMIALPFHPSNAYPIRTFNENLEDILASVEAEAAKMIRAKGHVPPLRNKIRDGRFFSDQAFIGGCSGGLYQNILNAAEILKGRSIGSEGFNLSVYPASQPMMIRLTENGTLTELMNAGVLVRSAFCGPCFGAGDVPGNGGFSIRHSTRNFPNREGSKPSEGQISYVALMDARSIAASALNGGAITAATELEHPPTDSVYTDYRFNAAPYQNRVYSGWKKANPALDLIMGPNIADWPEQIAMPENLIIQVASAIYDPVTTTDELIPSGETSSYRSNPVRLASYALSRKDPEYVGRAARIQRVEQARRMGDTESLLPDSPGDVMKGLDAKSWGIGSAVFALKPGDGSAREQAASCQRVLGGIANISAEYATKRYRSNLINWGMLPFILENAGEYGIAPGDVLMIPEIRKRLLGGETLFPATLIQKGIERPLVLQLPGLSEDEREILLAGCLINYYAK